MNPTHLDDCRLLSLTDDLLTKHVFGFIGKGYFRYVAGVSRRFKESYLVFYNSTNTSVPNAALDSITTAELMEREISDNETSYTRNLKRWQLCSYAAAKGDTILLDWGLSRGYQMDARTCATAAAFGQMEFLRYARETLACPWNSYTCTYATRAGEFAILQWAYAAGCEVSPQTCAAAAESGRLDILQWLRVEKKCPWDEATCQCAAEAGNLPMLKWARAHNCPWDASTCAAAAKGGHLELLMWARANGADWSAWTCHYAAKNNHMDVLVWARQQGCRWDAQTCAEASVSGHLEILKWARENGCSWHPDACMRFAESNGHHHVAKWIRSHSKDEYLFINGVMQLFAEEEDDDAEWE